jgi:hypothetical protein
MASGGENDRHSRIAMQSCCCSYRVEISIVRNEFKPGGRESGTFRTEIYPGGSMDDNAIHGI